jgi:uncharacterized protein (TIGR03435 family)
MRCSALLEDRFGLRVHREDRPMTTYGLEAVNPKLTKADAKSRTHCGVGPGPGAKDPRLDNPAIDVVVSCQNVTMAQFGEELQQFAPDSIYYPVLDETGLKGTWNFTLGFTSAGHRMASDNGAPPAAGAPASSEPSGAISLFDAVRKQLGLKLEKVTHPESVLVIDHINQEPRPN